MTPTDLKIATLKKLKVIASGESANSDDMALMGQKYTGLHAMLLERSMVIWALTEDIPEKAEQPLIMMLAALSADDFGVPEPRATRLKAEGDLDLKQPSVAERMLRKVIAPAHIDSTLRTEYF